MFRSARCASPSRHEITPNRAQSGRRRRQGRSMLLAHKKGSSSDRLTSDERPASCVSACPGAHAGTSPGYAARSVVHVPGERSVQSARADPVMTMSSTPDSLATALIARASGRGRPQRSSALRLRRRSHHSSCVRVAYTAVRDGCGRLGRPDITCRLLTMLDQLVGLRNHVLNSRVLLVSHHRLLSRLPLVRGWTRTPCRRH
jgi:hypothetical protein